MKGICKDVLFIMDTLEALTFVIVSPILCHNPTTCTLSSPSFSMSFSSAPGELISNELDSIFCYISCSLNALLLLLQRGKSKNTRCE